MLIFMLPGFPNIDHREAKPSATTGEIDRLLHDTIIDANAYPSPLNYMGFPRSVCTSVNNVIAHGIPDQYVIRLTNWLQ